MDPTHRLTDEEWLLLGLANRLLDRVTTHHSHACGCGLCEARMLTDVQDEESRRVRYTPAETGRN